MNTRLALIGRGGWVTKQISISAHPPPSPPNPNHPSPSPATPSGHSCTFAHHEPNPISRMKINWTIVASVALAMIIWDLTKSYTVSQRVDNDGRIITNFLGFLGGK